ncbi:MAG: stage II sporulation protein M, partial [Candidatus Norongarragalinales archaeon]
VRGSFSGYAVEARMLNAFETIFIHNLEVLLLILAFSLLYGAGAIFVLIWNASIIGVFLGKIARTAEIGAGVLGILPHGVFELLAYTTAALAGGILSRVIVLRRLHAIEEHQTIYDISKLTGWAIIFLALGALIESTGVIK